MTVADPLQVAPARAAREEDDGAVASLAPFTGNGEGEEVLVEADRALELARTEDRDWRARAGVMPPWVTRFSTC